MPWNHCGEQITDDDRTCPTCGVGKPNWTIKLDRTRVFILGGEGTPQSQADALESASDSGSPFCEECQKADDVDQAEDEDDDVDQDEEEDEDDDPDQDRQAKTLNTAAENGSPFCEECQKADQGQADDAEEAA